jgi:hypothetical protein
MSWVFCGVHRALKFRAWGDSLWQGLKLPPAKAQNKFVANLTETVIESPRIRIVPLFIQGRE